MTDDQFEQMSRNVEVLVRLAALAAVEGKKQMEQIAILSASGLQPKEIAKLLDTTPNTVSVGLSQLRRKKRSKSKS
jgi:DNA-binding CsgD family transcriptional regulator